ncbi:hypothetical protein LIER_38089 [Lithospermum erythrorhizon]|uniref:Uncharacterized protein n=1 Tax=Lithospermum erythrorhizon TaxID=34254 RepID=A0AAV3PX06_LITER
MMVDSIRSDYNRRIRAFPNTDEFRNSRLSCYRGKNNEYNKEKCEELAGSSINTLSTTSFEDVVNYVDYDYIINEAQLLKEKNGIYEVDMMMVVIRTQVPGKTSLICEVDMVHNGDLISVSNEER